MISTVFPYLYTQVHDAILDNLETALNALLLSDTTGENSYCTPVDQHVWPDKTTPLLQSVWSMAPSAIMIQCEWFIYIFYLSDTI